MKILWIDEETTGLDAVKHDIITLSAMIEIDEVVKRGINLKIQPVNWDNIDDEALKINGITREDMKTFDPPEVAHRKLKEFLKRHVNPYDSTDKYQPAGYNVGFDMNFLAQFWIKMGDPYFGSWVDYHKLDVASLVQILHLKGALDLENYKLVTVAKYLDIPLNAHDAREDIIATRKVCYKLLDMIEVKKERK